MRGTRRRGRPPAGPVRQVRPYVADLLRRMPEAGAIVTDVTYDVIAWNPVRGPRPPGEDNRRLRGTGQARIPRPGLHHDSAVINGRRLLLGARTYAACAIPGDRIKSGPPPRGEGPSVLGRDLRPNSYLRLARAGCQRFACGGHI
jgi:hypothetical protein